MATFADFDAGILYATFLIGGHMSIFGDVDILAVILAVCRKTGAISPRVASRVAEAFLPFGFELCGLCDFSAPYFEAGWEVDPSDTDLTVRSIVQSMMGIKLGDLTETQTNDLFLIGRLWLNGCTDSGAASSRGVTELRTLLGQRAFHLMFRSLVDRYDIKKEPEHLADVIAAFAAVEASRSEAA